MVALQRKTLPYAVREEPHGVFLIYIAVKQEIADNKRRNKFVSGGKYVSNHLRELFRAIGISK